jgi:SAM-dependent methyltransferase
MENLNALLNEPITGVITDVSSQDVMRSLPEHIYFAAGQSALRNIRLCMMAANRDDCRDILDLACGHGAELRTLKAAFPKARLTACDIVPEAVEFCRKTFDAIPVQSVPDPMQIPFPGEYDLIWVGSLFTHLPSGRWLGFLERCSQVLKPRGILVFTVHGRIIEQRLRSGTHTYGLNPASIIALLDEYDRTGFGHQNCGARSDYGLSLSSPSWVCQTLAQIPALQLLMCNEAGWIDTQDVVGCLRVAPSPPK